MPTGFSIICRSLLAHDPVYGPLMSTLNHQPFDGLWAMRLSSVRLSNPSNGHADANFPIEPKATAGSRTHNS